MQRSPGGRNTHPLASESTPCTSIWNGLVAEQDSPSARSVHDSATTPVRRSGSPRSWNCRSFTSSPTTPSASEKMDRPTSRSSSWPRCAPSLASVLRPGDANEVGRRLARHHGASTSRRSSSCRGRRWRPWAPKYNPSQVAAACCVTRTRTPRDPHGHGQRNPELCVEASEHLARKASRARSACRRGSCSRSRMRCTATAFCPSVRARVAVEKPRPSAGRATPVLTWRDRRHGDLGASALLAELVGEEVRLR